MVKKLFYYGENEISFLSGRDEKLGRFIEKTGFIERYVFCDFFEGLCYNIINQQLSMKSADTIFNRLCKSIGEFVPENYIDESRLIKAGLTVAKAKCISECARLFGNGIYTKRI